MGKLKNFFRLSGKERILFFEAIIMLALARLAVILVPFRYISPKLGQLNGNPKTPSTLNQVQVARLIGQAVNRASRHVPWNSKCLGEAIAVKMMLKRRNIPGTLFLGLKKDQQDTLQAHAWSACGENILTGKRGMRQFTVITIYT